MAKGKAQGKALARERARRRAAELRPGRVPVMARTVSERPVRDLVVDLHVHVDYDPDPDDPPPSDELWWYAEWGTDGESVGHEHSTTDVAELVTAVVGSARPGQPIRWDLRDDTGDDPSAPSVDKALAAAGVVLPDVGP